VLDETSGNGTLVSEYIFFNGKRVARRDADNSVKYYFADNLGSASVITNATGAMPPLAESDYYPFGGEIPITRGDPNHYKFTGKERDTESGLDNFGARYNASSLGRFMSPDPVGIMKQKLIDPQQWNMYAYVRNNPLRFIDPFGMYSCDGTRLFCGRVEMAYKQIQQAAADAEKGSDQQKQLNKVLKFLGKPGEANYVSIKAGSLSGGELGKADTSSNTDLLGNSHTTTQITLDFNQVDTTAKLNRGTPLLGAVPQDDGGLLGHEGTHGVDQFPLGHNPETRTQEHATEMNAYRNQSYIYGELGFKSMLDPGLSADTEAQRNQAISAGADRSTAAWCEERGGCN
jgi:RHS repeat-associated protein